MLNFQGSIDLSGPYRIISSITFASILLIVILSIMDAILTIELTSHGAIELNPVMAYYLDHSPIVFFEVKYFLTCASLFLIMVSEKVYLFKTEIQTKTLLILPVLLFGLVIQWEVYLILTGY